MTNHRIVIDTNVIVSALMFSNSTAMQAFTLAYTRGLIFFSS
jgi:predicted nucleic acid-binding protein